MTDKNAPEGYPPPGSPEPPRRRHSWIRRHKILTALIAIIGLIVVISIASTGGGGNGGQPAATRGDTTPTAPREEDRQETPSEDVAAGIGDPARDGKFEFTVTRIQPGVQRIGGEFGKEAQGQFVLVHVTVSNVGDESQLFDGGAQKLFDKEGREFSADTEAAIYLDESKSFLNEINPGNTVKGIVVFDIPKEVTPVKLQLHDSIFSSGVTVNLNRS
ncbi:DUF4352 domain-containing protein [Streptomyces swartbergensis]|uniref:DUF4352 domain-containing protein n=1 Tax=Streptomyces swartbergensis TaxID=487165 RepID=A0A243RSX9_9ACTN|nr:DUF4352 domain-containing protein [Streptomyces swartbergensis]OUC98112.1 hypothetical protein CA983_29600 [Streptomyces swartbergensis]